MKWLWDLFEGIQVNAVLREKIALAEAKYKDMEAENKDLNEQVESLTSKVESLKSQIKVAETAPLPAIPLISDEADALCLLQSWWGSRPANLSTKAVEFDAVNRELNLMPGTAQKLLERAVVQRYPYVVDQKGANFISFRAVTPASDGPVWSNPGMSDPRNPFRRR